MKVLAIVSSVLTADILTKIILPTQDWALHPRSTQHAISMVLMGAMFILFASAIGRRFTASLALLGSSMLANGIDELDGVARNPFVIGLNAFNVADVAMVVAAFAFMTGMTRLIYETLPARTS